MAELASPAFVRVGLLSVGQGEWGTFSPAETISLLSRADHRRNIVRGDYAAAVQHCPDSVPGWRKQVVEWLQELASVFRLDLNTLQTAVSFFDRILSLVHISSKQLQVCGLAALFFATKVLETAPFRAEEIEKYFAQVASPKDVMRAELNMLHILGWDANAFTTAAYVRGLLQLVPHEGLSRDLQAIAEVLSAWAMLEYDLLCHPTSVVGLACVAAACELRGFDVAPLVALLREGGIDMQVDRALCSQLVAVFRRDVDPAHMPAAAWPPAQNGASEQSSSPGLHLKGDGSSDAGSSSSSSVPDRDSPTLLGDPLDRRASGASYAAESSATSTAYALCIDDDPSSGGGASSSCLPMVDDDPGAVLSCLAAAAAASSAPDYPCGME